MSSTRRSPALAGTLYLITHITSVGAVILYGTAIEREATASAVKNLGNAQLTGALADVVLALAIIGTGVVLYPVIRRVSPTGAIAYVALRTVEAAVVLVGSAAMLGAVAQAKTGSNPEVLLELYRQAFTVGPGLVVGLHTVVLAAVLFGHRLVPRFIPWLGLLGAPLVTASNIGIIFELHSQTAPTALLAAVPVFAWEISLAVYLLAKGLRTAEPQIAGA